MTRRELLDKIAETGAKVTIRYEITWQYHEPVRYKWPEKEIKTMSEKPHGTVSVQVGNRRSPVAYNSYEVYVSVSMPVEDYLDPQAYEAMSVIAEEIGSEIFDRVEARVRHKFFAAVERS